MKKKNNKRKAFAAFSITATVVLSVCIGLLLAKTGILPKVIGNGSTSESENTESSSEKETISGTTVTGETMSSSQTTQVHTEKMRTTAVLNVREGPGTQYEKVGMLSEGEEVIRISEENGWSKIEYNGTEKYVSSDYLEKADETVTDSVTETESQPQTNAPVSSVTSKGYKIETKDGVTYVDGVLIANKTYSLPKNYGSGLTKECSDAFSAMKAAAANDGVKLEIVSGYRSYETQERIYNKYVAKDGKANADTYSARPGTSEHQTGLAMDLNSLSTSFGETKEGKWLAENCCKYGFIIRYPEGKQNITGYIYEPWHVRYVGTDKATAIYESGLCLEEYYGITSEYR